MKPQKLMCEYLRRQLGGLDNLSIPAGGDLLWRWFCDLNASRTYGMTGPNPISHTDIMAYGHIMRWPIQPHHVAILRAMDGVWLENAYAKKDKAPEGTKTLPLRSKGKLTAGMFDAMFGGG